MVYCNRKTDIPASTKHFAAIVFSTVHIPADERSRTNPGHGYPAESRPVSEYIAFSSPEEMQTWVNRNHTSNNFTIIEAFPKAIVTTTTVKVE